MSLSRRENPTPLPEGTRVVTVPFQERGVIEHSHKSICTILLDTPLKHTDRIHAAWDEVYRESDYDIAYQQDRVDDAKMDVQDAQDAFRHAQKALVTARARLRSERAELRKVKDQYDTHR